MLFTISFSVALAALVLYFGLVIVQRRQARTTRFARALNIGR